MFQSSALVFSTFNVSSLYKLSDLKDDDHVL